GRPLPAVVVAHDARNDLAVLQAEAHDLPAATIGDARALRPGELVLAVGHPYGVRNALTIGVVSSALPQRRDGVPQAPGGVPADRARLWQWGRERELICADVLLGPGNSGGPLADARGQVVGLNAMVANRLALAVPSHLVERLLARRGAPPVLGIGAQEVMLPQALAARAGVAAGWAVLVVEVEPGSPAERAGLLLGDVLVAADGRTLDGAGGLLAALEAHLAGAVQVTLLRGGVVRELSVDVAQPQAAQPEPTQPAQRRAA
ncbi:MAG: S1C family serine protease, partial [Chloroflexota bacterium]